tara:strand:- start:5606 stop:6481 length:876 start_codon:yes stop_codon:yes gene_type:complete
MLRRNFIKTALASSLASSAAFQAMALGKNNRYRKNIGIQLYTLRNQIAKDPVATLKAVADAGYKQVESYGFPNAGPMIEAAKDFGLAVNSSHFAWESVTNPTKEGVPPFAKILDAAKETGLSHLVVPYLHDNERGGPDAYKRLAENCNRAAAQAKKVDIQLSYHNHAFEFEPVEGTTGYQVLIDEFSPDMQFEVDVFWVVVGGKDPVELIRKLEGRVSQLHLKDLKKGMTLPEFVSVPKDAFQELGGGIIPMEPIIQTAKKAGVAHCHVEQDQSPDPIASINQSIQHLATL